MAYVPHDKFARRAKQEGYRARSAYKLLDLQRKFQILKKGESVLDLGAAPGSWLQVAAPIVGGEGMVMGLDRVPIKPLPFSWVKTFQKDIQDKDFIEFLKQQESRRFDVVLSDTAPTTSGVKERDQALSHELSLRVLEIAKEVLRNGGSMVLKIFEGPETPALVAEAKKYFQTVALVKPQASQKESKEFYAVARNYTKRIK